MMALPLPIPAPPSKAVARQLARRRYNESNPYGTLTHVMGSVLAEPTVDEDQPILAEIDAWLDDCDKLDSIPSGGQTSPGGCPAPIGSSLIEGASKTLAQAKKMADRDKNAIWTGRTSTDPKCRPKMKDIKSFKSLKDLLPVE